MKVGVPLCRDSAWKTARARADQAHGMSVEDRRPMLVQHQPSDDEETEGEEEEEEEGGGAGRKFGKGQEGGKDLAGRKEGRMDR